MQEKKLSIQCDTIEWEGKQIPLFSKEGFEVITTLWLQVGWNSRHHYSCTWMGVPVLQLPDDLVRLQETVFQVRPDVIIETGIAMGGSLLFYATLCKAMGHGRVIGIDIALRPPNRKRLEEHILAPFMELIDGDASDPAIVEQLEIEGKKVLVVLDSNHSKHHVLKELEIFAPLVSSGSYLIVCDGFKEQVAEVPRGKARWKEDNPKRAVEEFLKRHPEFELEERSFVTHLQGGWLRKC
ncbi:MAG: class I SAM-dependent methyltransferase [Chlamydiales bacterium]|nr:class I SAM-dependent methyltransferase [Chlamydiales bacterium]